MNMLAAFDAWKQRWPEAARELVTLLVPPVETRASMPGSEARVQSEVRLEAASKGVRLWRNNSFVLKDPETGRPVRAGLANDSSHLNEVLKSSDLIGWRPVTITQEMVGTVLAQFVSIECKRPGWKLTPGDKRGQAQARWLSLVIADGGYGAFISETGRI